MPKRFKLKILGNILTKSKINSKPYINVVKDRNKLIDSVPTLIVGWTNVKELYSNVNILDWKIDDMTYWTFGRMERRENMENDIIRFENMVLMSSIKEIEYDYFSVITKNNSEKTEFFKKVQENVKKTSYLTKNIIYIYFDNDNKITGISLDDIEYIGKNKDKVISLFKENSMLLTDKDIYDYNIKRLFSDKLYIIPYLCS